MDSLEASRPNPFKLTVPAPLVLKLNRRSTPTIIGLYDRGED